MRFRLSSALSSLTTLTALLVGCGTLGDPTDEPVDPSTGAPLSDGGADAYGESPLDAQADGSVGPLDGSVGPMDGAIEPIDASADGAPDAAEPACVEGDVTVMSPSDAAPFASTTCIHGSLTIEVASAVALPRLREVSGSVVVRLTSSAFSFPALEVIGADFHLATYELSTFSSPLLRSVAGTFEVVAVDSGVSIDAPQLSSLGGLQVSGTGTLDKLSVPALETITGDARFSLIGLQALALPNLERIEGALVMDAVKGLTSVDVPRLRDVVGDVYFAYEHTPISVTFPALEHAGSFTIGGTDNRFQALSFPVLTHVGPVSISLANQLNALSMPELVECGALRLDGVALTTLRLPELKKATGEIWVRSGGKGAPVLASVGFPKLEEAESIWLSDLPQLASIDLARLTNVTNELRVLRAPRVTQLSLPSLTSVGVLYPSELATIATISAPVLKGSATTTITIDQAPMLSRVDFSAVTNLEGLQLGGADRLTTLSLPAASAVKWVEIANLSALRNIAFPALESVSSVTLSGLRSLTSVDIPQLHSLSSALVVDRAPQLANLGPFATVPTSLKFLHLTNIGAASLAFPNLTETDNLFLSDNYALTNVSFPALVRVSTGDVKYCPELPSCSVDVVNAHLVSGIIGRQALAPCTP